MPSISYEKYCKIAGIDESKTSEKKESKNYEKMQKQSYSELFGAYGVESLSHFTVAELKEELSARNLGTQGVKSDLISRLEESYKSESSKDHKRKSPERDAGDKKHQKTDASMELDMEGKNPGNVAGGYKATLHNPNSSEEAKEHARKMLKEMGEDETPKADQEQDFDIKESLKGKNKGNVIGGYKATLHNPNSSEEAKEKARAALEEMGVDPEAKEADEGEVSLEGKNLGNVIGGYRATLHNPNSSEEAKEHAKKMLKEMDVDPEGHADSHQYASAEEAVQDGKNPGNVIGGYRATLHNPNSSEDAKEHARKELEKLGADPEGHADKHADTEGKNLNNVAGGYKATLSNPNASQEAKDHAQKELDRMGVDANETTDSQKTYHKADTEGKNIGNVIGGYKATLKNPNVSEEAKENAEEQLEKLDAASDSSKKSGEADIGGKNINNVIGGYKATLKNPNVSEEAKEHAKAALENLSN